MKYLFKFFLPAILISGLLAFFYLDFDSFFVWDNLTNYYLDLRERTNSNYGYMLTFFCFLYFLSVAFSLPIALILTILSGALFGWFAIPACIVAGTMGCWVVYFASKGAFHEYLSGLANPYLSRVTKDFFQSPFTWLLSFRLIPILPLWLGNIIPGILGMNNRDFLFATLLGYTPGTIIYVSFGNGIDLILQEGITPNLSVLENPGIYIPLFGLFILGLASFIIRYKKQKRLEVR